jgi:DNA invertase Pin-like site-specific DNA recombinase
MSLSQHLEFLINMAVIGYARVSSLGQSLDVQLDKLNGYGCDKIYSEKRSGVTAQRPELSKCLDYVREGDVLVITKLDRLARSTLHLHKMVDYLNSKDVGFKVLDQGFDTTTKEGRLMFSVLASIAEFENEIRKERQNEGIQVALEKGIKFGRTMKLSHRQIKQMKLDRESGLTISELENKYNLSKPSVYRYLRSKSDESEHSTQNL